MFFNFAMVWKIRLLNAHTSANLVNIVDVCTKRPFYYFIMSGLEYLLDINTRELIQTIKRKPNMPRYIVDGFVFHVNITKGNPPMIYLRCLEYKRLGCHARAVIPYDGSIQDIRVKKPHNHPPDFAAEEKIVFIRELKEVMLKNPSVPSRTVYATLAEMYPNAAREYHFEAMRHKMNRWKKLQDE